MWYLGNNNEEAVALQITSAEVRSLAIEPSRSADLERFDVLACGPESTGEMTFVEQGFESVDDAREFITWMVDLLVNTSTVNTIGGPLSSTTLHRDVAATYNDFLKHVEWKRKSEEERTEIRLGLKRTLHSTKWIMGIIKQRAQAEPRLTLKRFVKLQEETINEVLAWIAQNEKTLRKEGEVV